MYDAGARTFIEVGPGQVLTGLVGRILGDQPHAALASDSKSRPGMVQFAHFLGQLLVRGVELDLDPLYSRRDVRTFDPNKLERETGETEHPKSAWVVNGTRNRPLNAVEPRLLGAVNRPLTDAERTDRGLPPAGQAAIDSPTSQASPTGATAETTPTAQRRPSTSPTSATGSGAHESPEIKPIAARPPKPNAGGTVSSSHVLDSRPGMKNQESQQSQGRLPGKLRDQRTSRSRRPRRPLIHRSPKTRLK